MLNALLGNVMQDKVYVVIHIAIVSLQLYLNLQKVI